MPYPYEIGSLAHQEWCPQLQFMHSSAISCMLYSFDSYHAEECQIMHAVMLDSRYAQHRNTRHAVVCVGHHAQGCNIMHAGIMNSSDAPSCTAFWTVITQWHSASSSRRRKIAKPPLKWVTESRRLSRTVLSRTTLWA